MGVDRPILSGDGSVEDETFKGELVLLVDEYFILAALQVGEEGWGFGVGKTTSVRAVEFGRPEVGAEDVLGVVPGEKRIILTVVDTEFYAGVGHHDLTGAVGAVVEHRHAPFVGEGSLVFESLDSGVIGVGEGPAVIEHLLVGANRRASGFVDVGRSVSGVANVQRLAGGSVECVGTFILAAFFGPLIVPPLTVLVDVGESRSAKLIRTDQSVGEQVGPHDDFNFGAGRDERVLHAGIAVGFVAPRGGILSAEGPFAAIGFETGSQALEQRPGGGLLGAFANGCEAGNHDADEQGDDGNHHHQLDDGERTLVSVGLRGHGQSSCQMGRGDVVVRHRPKFFTSSLDPYTPSSPADMSR